MRVRSARGLTLMELMMGIAIFGIIMAGAASLFRGFEQESADLNRRIQSASLESNLALALKNPALVKELLVDEPGNERLKHCLESGCAVGTTGPIQFNRTLDWAFRGFDFKGTFIERGIDYVEIDMSLTAKSALFYMRDFKIYLPRRNFVPLPNVLAELKCPRDHYLNGVDFHYWTPICEHM